MSKRSLRRNPEPEIDTLLDFGLPEDAVPYIRLWATVLLSGVRAYQAAVAKGLTSGPDIAWVLSTDRHPCSFHWICELMNLDPDVARNRLIQQGTLK